MTTVRATLHADLPLEAVRARLKAAIDGPFGLRGGKPVFGVVRPHTAGLYRRRRFNNPFRIRMGVVFEPDEERFGDGVTLHCVSTIDHWGRLILTLATMVLMGLAVVVRHETGAGSGLAWGVAAAGALAVGAVYALGRHLSRDEPAFLREFLVRTLDARVVETPRGG